MKFSNTFVVIFLITLGTGVCLQRYHTREEPVECDTAHQSVLAHEWNHGRLLYSDLWINKPPGGIVTFAAAEKLVGFGSATILLLSALTSLLTLLGIYVAAAWMAQDRLAGVWAAFFWTLVNGNPYLEANQPMLEGFVNVFWVWGLALAIRALEEKSPYRILWLCGCFLAAASFYKHHLVIPNVLFMIGILIADWWQGRRQPRTLLHEGFSVTAPTLILWGGISSYFLAAGRFHDLWDTLITRSLQYAQTIPFQTTPYENNSLFSNILNSLRLSTLTQANSHHVFYSLFPLALLGLPGLMKSRGTETRYWIVLGGYAVSAWVGIALPGRFYPHYYQLFIPPLVIATGISIGWMNRAAPPAVRAWVLLGSCVIAVFMAWRELRFYRYSAMEWSRHIYGDVYLATKTMGEEIGLNLLPSETFYEMGGEPGLYYYSRRRPPVGILFSNEWDSRPSGSVLMQRNIRDLSQHPPELLVTTQYWLAWGKNADLPIMQWCRKNYRFFPTRARHGPFLLYLRRGGRLEQKLFFHRSAQ